MTEYEIRITGVHYGANGDSVAGQKDTEEMHVRTRDLQFTDLDFAFTPYYNKPASAVKRMSDKLDSAEANMLFGLLKGMLKKYPATEST